MTSSRAINLRWMIQVPGERTVASENLFSAFGETSSLGGTTFGFTGQRFDSETDLYYYKHRFTRHQSAASYSLIQLVTEVEI